MVYFDTVKTVIYGPTCHPLYFFFLFHPFLPRRARCSAPPDRRRPPPPAHAHAGSLRPLRHRHRAGAGLVRPPCTADGLLRPPFLHPPRAARRSRGRRSPSLAPPTPSRPPWTPRSTSPAMAAQLELAHHGRPDRGRPPWLPPARGQPPWPWHLLLLAHGRAAQPHLLPMPTAARAGARLRLPRAHGLTEEDDVDVGRVGPLESDGSAQPASKEYIPLQGPTQPIQPTNQTRVDVGRTRPNPFRPTNQTHGNRKQRV